MKFSTLKGWHLFLVLTLCLTTATFFFNEYILTSELYQGSISDQLSIDQINKMIAFNENYGWLAYLFNVIVILVRVNFVSFCIYVGFTLSQKKVKYRSILKIALLCDFIFVLYVGVRIFLIMDNELETIMQLQNFWPLTLYSLFSETAIPKWLFYPLYVMNIAEIIYWLLLAYGLTKILHDKFLKNLKTVMTSYGTGLLLWILTTVFVQLYLLSPSI